MKEEKNKDFWFKVIAGGIFTISWLVLIGIRLGSDISLKIPLIVSIILTILFIISLFGKKIYHLTDKLKEKDKEPKPMNKEEIIEILKNVVKDMWNYIEKGVPIKRKLHNINNSIIYEHHLKLAREQEFGEEITDKIIILINATFKDLEPAILPEDCNEEELNNAINKMSKNPSNPDIEESELTTDQFGKPTQKTRKVSYSKPKEEEESVV